jgi:energy-coupling factor transporter ATP-binding protein EcfA2
LAYILDKQSWSQLFERLIQQNGRAAIVGPHGTGKTTLLETLRHHLSTVGTMTTQDQPFPAKWPTSDGLPPLLMFISRDVRDHDRQRRQLSLAGEQGRWLLIDGIERWSAWHRFRWLRWTSRNYRIIVTAHRATWLPTLMRTAPDWELVARIIRELVPDDSDRTMQVAYRFWCKNPGNVRETLRALYDWWAEDTGSIAPAMGNREGH